MCSTTKTLFYMKKILVVLAAALMAVTANAQWYVGGSLLFDTAKNTDQYGKSMARIEFAPEVGYTISDKSALGVSFSFDNIGGGTGVEIAPYYRYFMTKMGPVSLFVDGQLLLDFRSLGGGESTSTFGLGVAPGIAIPVSDNLSFVGHLGRIGYYDNSFQIDCSPAHIGMGLYYSF